MRARDANKPVGLWIDHRGATLVAVTGEAATVQHIASGVARQVRLVSLPAPLAADDVRDRRIGQQLHRFYDTVVTALNGADAILIMGPGEAKRELAQALQAAHPGRQLADVAQLENADRRTERQIVARVRAWAQG